MAGWVYEERTSRSRTMRQACSFRFNEALKNGSATADVAFDFDRGKEGGLDTRPRGLFPHSPIG